MLSNITGLRASGDDAIFRHPPRAHQGLAEASRKPSISRSRSSASSSRGGKQACVTPVGERSLTSAAWRLISRSRREASERERLLEATADSLRNVVSIRDFLVAVQVGAETAVGMLDKIETKLIEAMAAINEGR